MPEAKIDRREKEVKERSSMEYHGVPLSDGTRGGHLTIPSSDFSRYQRNEQFSGFNEGNWYLFTPTAQKNENGETIFDMTIDAISNGVIGNYLG